MKSEIWNVNHIRLCKFTVIGGGYLALRMDCVEAYSPDQTEPECKTHVWTTGGAHYVLCVSPTDFEAALTRDPR